MEQRRNRAADFDYFMHGARYSNGYLHKTFAIKSLTKLSGPPDVEELQIFNQVSLLHRTDSFPDDTHEKSTQYRVGPLGRWNNNLWELAGHSRRKAAGTLQLELGVHEVLSRRLASRWPGIEANELGVRETGSRVLHNGLFML